jgi:hypothetical protein
MTNLSQRDSRSLKLLQLQRKGLHYVGAKPLSGAVSSRTSRKYSYNTHSLDPFLHLPFDTVPLQYFLGRLIVQIGLLKEGLVAAGRCTWRRPGETALAKGLQARSYFGAVRYFSSCGAGVGSPSGDSAGAALLSAIILSCVSRAVLSSSRSRARSSAASSVESRMSTR